MRNISKASLAALSVTGFLAGTLLSTPVSARPMTAQDLATLKRVGAPAISPNEKWIVYQVTETDPESYARSTGLYLLDRTNDNAEPVRIADKSNTSEHSPAFSVDGKSLYYLSDASGSEQLWTVTVSDTGKASKAIQASDLSTDIAGYKLSRTGKKIAVWGDIAKDCSTFGCETEDSTIGNGNRAAPGPGTGREYDELFVRHWSSWETPGNYSRIFAFDLTAGKLSGAGRAMDGDLVGDSPSKPFGGGEEIIWAPRDEAVIFTLRKADKDEPKSTNLDIYASSPNGGKARPMPANTEATDSLPTVSPDGELFAWAAMARPGYEADRMVVKLTDKNARNPRALTKDWDRSVGSIAWGHNNKSLYVTAQEVLDHPAFKVDTESGAVTRLTKGGNVSNVIPLKDGSIIYTKKTLKRPNDVYHMSTDGVEKQLTDVNSTALGAIDKVSVQRFDFAGANGDQVWGQIIKPADAKGILPMAFLVHGGPQGSFGNSWSTRWNPKVMAAQGFAVVTIDFHGSAGYGQKFMDSINQDWGGKPLEDLKLGYAAALKIDKQIDGERACALGASYGGYMMNWIAGNWPDRFKCIINHAGIFDLRSFAFSTEELWFDQWDHGGPWTERPDAEKWNPINHIEKWKTPTLFIHGEKDFRIPYTQSLMPFTYAQEQGIPSKLLIFPDENHWVLKGKNSVQWHKTVFDWMKKWTGGQEGED